MNFTHQIETTIHTQTHTFLLHPHFLSLLFIIIIIGEQYFPSIFSYVFILFSFINFTLHFTVHILDPIFSDALFLLSVTLYYYLFFFHFESIFAPLFCCIIKCLFSLFTCLLSSLFLAVALVNEVFALVVCSAEDHLMGFAAFAAD